MAKLKKITLSLLALIALTIITLIIVLNFFITADTFKPYIINTIKQQTGATLAIDGDLAWQLLPNIGLVIHQVSLQTSEKQHIAADKIDLGVQLLPLLHKKLILTHIDIVGGTLKDSSMNITQLNAHTTNFALDQDVPVKLSAHVTLPEAGIDEQLKLKSIAHINEALTHFIFTNASLKLNKMQAKGDIDLALPEAGDDIIQHLKLKATLHLNQIPLPQLNLSDLSLTLNGQNGLYNFSNIQAQLYGGTLSGNASVNMQSGTPVITEELTATNIQLDDLLQHTAGKKYLSGNSTITTQLTTKGTNAESLTQHLNGTVTVNASDGKTDELDLLTTINQGLSLLHKSSSDSPTNTVFDTLTASSTVQQGLAKTSIELSAPSYEANAAGTLNCVNQRANLKVNLQITNVTELSEFTFPMSITGPFDSLKVKLDTKALLSQIVQQQGQDLLKNLQKRLFT